MKNPAAISQPKLQVPIATKRKKGDKGNLPYLSFRRKMRKSMFR